MNAKEDHISAYENIPCSKNYTMCWASDQIYTDSQVERLENSAFGEYPIPKITLPPDQSGIPPLLDTDHADSVEKFGGILGCSPHLGDPAGGHFIENWNRAYEFLRCC